MDVRSVDADSERVAALAFAAGRVGRRSVIPTPPAAMIATATPSARAYLYASIGVDRSSVHVTNRIPHDDVDFSLSVEFSGEPHAVGPFVVDWGDGTAGEGVSADILPAHEIAAAYPGGAAGTFVGSGVLSFHHAYQALARRRNHVTVSVDGRVIASVDLETEIGASLGVDLPVQAAADGRSSRRASSDDPPVVPADDSASASPPAATPPPAFPLGSGLFDQPGQRFVDGPSWRAFAAGTKSDGDVAEAVTYQVAGDPGPVRFELRTLGAYERCDFTSGPTAGRFVLARHGIPYTRADDRSDVVVPGLRTACGDDAPAALSEDAGTGGVVAESPGPLVRGHATVRERIDEDGASGMRRQTLLLDVRTSLPIMRSVELEDGRRFTVSYSHLVVAPAATALPAASPSATPANAAPPMRSSPEIITAAIADLDHDVIVPDPGSTTSGDGWRRFRRIADRSLTLREHVDHTEISEDRAFADLRSYDLEYQRPAFARCRGTENGDETFTVVWRGGSLLESAIVSPRYRFDAMPRVVPRTIRRLAGLYGVPCGDAALDRIAARLTSLGAITESVGPSIDGRATFVETAAARSVSDDHGLLQEELVLDATTALPVEWLGFDGSTLLVAERYHDASVDVDVRPDTFSLFGVSAISSEPASPTPFYALRDSGTIAAPPHGKPYGEDALQRFAQLRVGTMRIRLREAHGFDETFRETFGIGPIARCDVDPSPRSASAVIQRRADRLFEIRGGTPFESSYGRPPLTRSYGYACGDDDPPSLRDRFVSAGALDERVGPIVDGHATAVVTVIPPSASDDGGLTREQLVIDGSGRPIERLGYVGSTLEFSEW